jgi:hypothetical protein
MIRYVDASPTGDAWELQAHNGNGDWQIVNAGTPDKPVGGRFPNDAVVWRLVDVHGDGRVLYGDPVSLADARTLGPARRRFTCGEADWLETHGVDVRVAATFPRGTTLAEIRDALS